MRDSSPPSGLPFRKMHGLGNDFVVLDGRDADVVVTPALVRALADRRLGVGFDQLALIEDAPAGGPTGGPASGPRADLALRFWNADGSQAGACGNATRCIARAEMDRTGAAQMTIATERGLLRAWDEGQGVTTVDMGPPATGWRDIPLSHEVDTLALPLPGSPTATSMGNPHCTFFVDDARAVDLAAFGPLHESHPLFPQRTNVQVVQVLAPDRLRARVWERGTGVTPASGSSSCAVAVAAARRGLTGRRVTVMLDGGALIVEWAEDGVHLTGPTAEVFWGAVSPSFLEAHA